MRRIHIPRAWGEAAETILAERPPTILVLGGGDVGKSTFCRFLISELIKAGQRVAFVDADVGQKDLGPPATVTLGYPDGPETLETAAPAGFYFVGSTGPSGRFLPLVVGTARLVSTADASFVVVATTGFIEGAGRVLKAYKIEALRPDLIVAIERRCELEAILAPFRHGRIMRIRPSRKARPKDRWDRDMARERAFGAYFEKASRLELDLDYVAVQRVLLFTGAPVTIEGALYAEQTAEGLIAVSEGLQAQGNISKCLRPGFEQSLLCGVADERNECLGLAILEAIDFERRRLALLTPVAADAIRALQLGDLYVAPDGREVGRVGLDDLPR